ncbi:MAG TPA: efflux RND transporter periplasmic adaptor subunit [Terriglobales bacterium]|nr:efflux RND transporter periplasmic adaptor subunit [Terriglobales bacterium]HUL17303.1 efflux RND transporter periplasmic adaptor subunit [Terriglobales bacterium]
MRKGWMWVGLSAALLAAGCGDEKASSGSVTNAASPAPVQPKPAVEAAGDPGNAPMVVSGPIIVEHEVELTAQRDGLVQKIYFDAPARVKTGALLAELDGRQIEANLEAAKAKTRSIEADLKNWEAEEEVLKADYERQKNLWDLGLTSKEQLEHARYKAESDQWDIKRVMETLNTAKQEERSLELELEKTKIKAPFDGLIARRYVREGQNVAKNDRLFWVTAEAPLLVRFTLPEKLFGKMRAGQQVEITSTDAPNEKHIARVKEVSPVVDPSSGTFEVLAELTGERGSLRPGMTASVHLENPH